MFTCAFNGHTSQPREKPILIVTEKRIREYENGGKGWEIVKEEKFCQKHGKERQ